MIAGQVLLVILSGDPVVEADISIMPSLLNYPTTITLP